MPRRGTRRSWRRSPRRGNEYNPYIDDKPYDPCLPSGGSSTIRSSPAPSGHDYSVEDLFMPLSGHKYSVEDLYMAPSGHLRDPRRPLRPPTARCSLRLRPSSPQKGRSEPCGGPPAPTLRRFVGPRGGFPWDGLLRLSPFLPAARSWSPSWPFRGGRTDGPTGGPPPRLT